MLRDYDTTGLVDTVTVRRIARALDVDVLVQTRLVRHDTTEAAPILERWSQVVGPNALKGLKPESSLMERTQVYFVMFDGRSGRADWTLRTDVQQTLDRKYVEQKKKDYQPAVKAIVGLSLLCGGVGLGVGYCNGPRSLTRFGSRSLSRGVSPG
jgi:hypothetical protein